MKKILFSLFAMATLTANAQETIFFEDFESYSDFTITDFGGWKQHDLDGGETWGITDVTFTNQNYIGAGIIFNNSQATGSSSGMNAYAGQKGLYFFASGANETTFPNNDWTISPKISLIGVTGGKLELYAKGNQVYGPDRFNISVSTSQDVSTFTTFLNTTPVVPPSTGYTKYTFDLSAYDGQEIYIAINCTTNDGLYLMIDNFKVYKGASVAPTCSTLSLPADLATNVAVNTSLSWAEAPNADSYNIYLDTNSNPTTLIGNSTNTSFSPSNLALNTTYYWKVVPKNHIGEATGCTVYSFTTTATPSYCGPLTFESEFFGMLFDGTEPISLVDFAGINNPSDPDAEEAPHEMFLDKVATVEPGNPYTITIEGNTVGEYTNKFAVFIDWNQNGILNDTGEVYEVTQTLTNSDGTDGQKVEHVINVPANALAGNTRMRVKKVYDDEGTDVANLLNPCIGGSFGQAEDYTVNVNTLAVSETKKANIKAYPNPVKDIFNIEAQGKIRSVKVYDATGKQLFTKDLNEAKSQIDFSRFNSGVYVVTTVLENGTSTSTKVVKK